MAVLTVKHSRELVIPVPPATVYRTIVCLGPNRWRALPSWQEYGTALEAVVAVRVEVERTSRTDVFIELEWQGVDTEFIPPTTGTALR